MKTTSLVVAIALCQLAAAAPASDPLMKREGFLSYLESLFKGSSSSTASTAAATTAAATTTAATAASTATSAGFNLDSLLSNGKVDEWLNYFGLGSSGSSAVTSATAVATSAATSATADDWFPNFTFKQTSAATSTSYTPTSASVPTTFTTSTRSSSAATASATQGVTGSDTEFAEEILESHNTYRAEHNAAALTWNNDAYEYAQNNADNYDCLGVLTHTHGQYGENLAAGFKDGPAAVKAWYVEGQTYDYLAANTYDHFTQLVWKSTTSVGCAYKDCTSEGWGLYVVCEYDPPGNVIGQDKANVLEG